MTLYQYKAIDDDGKVVTGSLEAANEDMAKSAVDNLHLGNVELKEATRVRIDSQNSQKLPTSSLLMFAFEGTDEQKQIRRGTIQAESKYQAFSKLSNDQHLTLSMLSPLGVTPQFRDHDLENWQKKTASSSKKTLGFTNIVPEVEKASSEIKPTPSQQSKSNSVYMPVIETLRLYSGWLLAWYALFVAIGYYATQRELQFDIPFVRGFYLSPLIFSFTVAIFFFLLLSTVHKFFKLRLLGGILCTLLGLAIFVAVRLSIVS